MRLRIFLLYSLILVPFLGFCQNDSAQFYFDQYDSEYGITRSVYKDYEDTIISNKSYKIRILVDENYIDTLFLRVHDSIVYCWQAIVNQDLPYYSRKIQIESDTFYIKNNDKIVEFISSDSLISVNINNQIIENVLLMKSLNKMIKLEFLFHYKYGFLALRNKGNLVWWPKSQIR